MIEYTVRVFGDKTEWYLNGQLHRIDGPAVEFPDGSKEWWLNGLLHRENGPAMEDANGSRYWCLNGRLHREDGPAGEFANRKEWWLNGQRISEEEFNKRTQVKELTVNQLEELLGYKIKVVGE